MASQFDCDSTNWGDEFVPSGQSVSSQDFSFNHLRAAKSAKKENARLQICMDDPLPLMLLTARSGRFDEIGGTLTVVVSTGKEKTQI